MLSLRNSAAMDASPFFGPTPFTPCPRPTALGFLFVGVYVALIGFGVWGAQNADLDRS